MHQSALAESQSVFSLGLSELSELPVARQGILKDVKGPWHGNEFRVLEVSGISQCCQWGATGCNKILELDCPFSEARQPLYIQEGIMNH